jgi:hypothetical protein
MINSSSNLIAILFGLAVFAVIVSVGWRSVQNRRILRLRNADGQETIIVADEGDKISSIATTTETMRPAADPSTIDADSQVADPLAVAATARKPAATEAETNASGRDRLSRVVSSNK